jgi:hypothetical protein
VADVLEAVAMCSLPACAGPSRSLPNGSGFSCLGRPGRLSPLTLQTGRLIEPGAIATASATILSDRTGYLPACRAHSRRYPMQQLVREVRVKLDTGRILRILTNDLTASPQQIADLYKRRWTIELFFRWIKQTLKIRHFIGRSENAVRIQIAVALIAFLLRIAHDTQHAISGQLRAGQVRKSPFGGRHVGMLGAEHLILYTSV